jgi:hypothetical protein
MRKAEARTREALLEASATGSKRYWKQALLEAMGRALDAVRASDARGLFEHSGYRQMAQSL